MDGGVNLFGCNSHTIIVHLVAGPMVPRGYTSRVRWFCQCASRDSLRSSLGHSTLFLFYFFYCYFLVLVLALRFYACLLPFNVVHLCVLFLIVSANNAHECYTVLGHHIRVIALPSGTTRAHDNRMESRVMPIISFRSRSCYMPFFCIRCLFTSCLCVITNVIMSRRCSRSFF